MLIPLLLLLSFGLFGSWQYWHTRRSDWLFWALTGLGLSIVFGLFVLEIRLPVVGRLQLWRMINFWPTIVITVALAYFLTFILTGFKRGQLLLASMGIGILGVIAFAFSLQLLSVVDVQTGQAVWPALAILLAMVLLSLSWLVLFRQRRHNP